MAGRRHTDRVDALRSLRERGRGAEGFEAGYRSRDAIVRIGQMLRAMRTDAGLSQAALAERAGMTQAEISRIENGLGRHGPSVETLNRLAAAMRLRLVMGAQAAGTSGDAEADANGVNEERLVYKAVL